jgi:hypothetical protein
MATVLSNSSETIQWVWSVQYTDPDDGMDYELYLHEDKAYEVATNEAIKHMESLGCNGLSTNPDWVQAYKDVVAQRISNPESSMISYRDWLAELPNQSARLDIWVTCKRMILDIAINPNSATSCPSTKQGPIAKLVDIPCRVCGKGVNTSESTCWFCGVDNPARK